MRMKTKFSGLSIWFRDNLERKPYKEFFIALELSGFSPGCTKKISIRDHDWHLFVEQNFFGEARVTIFRRPSVQMLLSLGIDS